MSSKLKQSKHKHQEPEFWNVIEIVDEDEVERRYKVVWEGINPATGKPWPRDWVPYEDCTPELKADWRKKKARMESGTKKKPARRASSIVSKGTASSSNSSRNSSLRSTASTESTRKRRANKLSAPTEEEESLNTRPNKRRKLAGTEDSQLVIKAEVTNKPKSPFQATHKKRVENIADEKALAPHPIRPVTKRRPPTVQIQSSKHVDSFEEMTQSPAPSSADLEHELDTAPEPIKFGPPKPLTQRAKDNSSTKSPPKLTGNQSPQTVKFGPPKHAKKSIPSKPPSPQLPSLAQPPTRESTSTSEATKPVPGDGDSQAKRKARPNPWASLADDTPGSAESEQAARSYSPPKKRRLPRKPTPPSKSTSRAGSIKSSDSSFSRSTTNTDEPGMKKLSRTESESRPHKKGVAKPLSLSKSKSINGHIPLRLQNEVAKDGSIVPDSEPEAGPSTPNVHTSSSPIYPPDEERAPSEEVEEIPEQLSTTQPHSPSSPPPKVLKPVQYVSPSAFKPYLPSAPPAATQVSNSGSIDNDPITQFSPPSKSQTRHTSVHERIDDSIDNTPPEPDITMDDSKEELTVGLQARKEEEEESTQDLLEEMKARMQEEEEESTQDLLAIDEEVALTQNLLSLEEEDEGERIYFPPDVIHSFEAGYIGGSPYGIVGEEDLPSELELLHAEEPAPVVAVESINPALLEPTQEKNQPSPERSPSSSPVQPQQPNLPETLQPAPPIPLSQPDASNEQDLIAQLRATIQQLESDLSRETARVKFAQSEEASIRHAYISVSQNHTDIVRELNAVRAQLSQSQIDCERAEKRAQEGVQGVKAFYADIIANLKKDVEKVQAELTFVREKERRTDADGIRRKAAMHDEIQSKLKAQVRLSDELAFGRRQTEMKLDELEAAFKTLQANHEKLESEKEAIRVDKDRLEAENRVLRMSVEQVKVGDKYYYFCGHADGCRERFDTYEELEAHWNGHLSEDFPDDVSNLNDAT